VLSMLHEGHERNIYSIYVPKTYTSVLFLCCAHQVESEKQKRVEAHQIADVRTALRLLAISVPALLPQRLVPQRERWRRRWVKAAQRGRCHRSEEEHRSRLLPGLRQSRVFLPLLFLRVIITRSGCLVRMFEPCAVGRPESREEETENEREEIEHEREEDAERSLTK
jgi:hypothetical protein